MKKSFSATILTGGLIAMLFLSGCEQFKQTAQNLRTEGEKAVGNITKEAEDAKNKVLETKAAIDTKAQQLKDAADAMKNAADAMNKLAK